MSKICDNIWTSGDFNQIIEFINMGIIDTRKIKFFLGYVLDEYIDKIKQGWKFERTLLIA